MYHVCIVQYVQKRSVIRDLKYMHIHTFGENILESLITPLTNFTAVCGLFRLIDP